MQCYTYDAWNRLATVAHGYRVSTADGGDGLVHSGKVTSVMGTFDTTSPYAPHATGYDALGRRIMKSVAGTGSMDATYHYYFNGQSDIEEKNGSGLLIKQNVWGLQYVDELVQVGLNGDAEDGGEECTEYHWVCQDANYNVLGIVDDGGVLTERYEYSAYGQRQVFTSSGTNDPGCYTPTSGTKKWYNDDYGIQEAWGYCEFGHQGLYHDEESNLVYNRARMLQPTLGRFMEEDPLGYADSFNLFEYQQDAPDENLDPSGTTMPSRPNKPEPPPRRLPTPAEQLELNRIICYMKHLPPSSGFGPGWGNALQKMLDGGKIWVEDLNSDGEGTMGSTSVLSNGYGFSIDSGLLGQAAPGTPTSESTLGGILVHENLHRQIYQTLEGTILFGVIGKYVPAGTDRDGAFRSVSEYANHVLEYDMRNALEAEMKMHPHECDCRNK